MMTQIDLEERVKGPNSTLAKYLQARTSDRLVHSSHCQAIGAIIRDI